jgi:hypothetical protein
MTMTTTTETTPAERNAKKRTDGEGSIRWSEAKRLWIGRVMVGRRLDGKPDVREVSAKTQKLCRERLDALKLQAANGSLSSSEAAGLTVAAFLDRWLTMVEDSRRVATVLRYRGYVTSYFKPALGTKRLSKQTHDDIQQFLTASLGRFESAGRFNRSYRHVLSTTSTWRSGRRSRGESEGLRRGQSDGTCRPATTRQDRGTTVDSSTDHEPDRQVS